MAKPPKTTPGSNRVDTSSGTGSGITAEAPTSPRLNMGSSTPSLPDPTVLPGTRPGLAQPEQAAHRHTVEVRDRPEATAALFETRLHATSHPADPVLAVPHPRAPAPEVLAPELAALLTNVDSSVEGIRYDRHKRTYVDTAEGTVMLRKNYDGEYQQTSALELVPSGFLLEPVPGTKLWRRKGQEVPNKRPRLEPAAQSMPPHTRVAPAWEDWGLPRKPVAGESIEIDGLHYPIVPQDADADTHLVFIKHPRFSPERFEGFELMLRHTPELQPMGVVKKHEQWTVIDGLPFKKPLTAYVAEAFPWLADYSALNVAKSMFNRASYSETIDAHGLYALFDVFDHWARRPGRELDRQWVLLRQDMLDPLVMLPALPKTDGMIQIPPRLSNDIQRLDFNPQRLNHEWSNRQVGYSLWEVRDMLHTALRREGYEVSFNFRHQKKDALLIQRAGIDLIFIMVFKQVLDGAVYRPDPPRAWIRNKAFLERQEPGVGHLLRKHLDEHKVIYLVCVEETLPSGQKTIVVIREE